MSGPATSPDDAIETVPAASVATADIEVTESRSSTVGALTVRRALPQRARRTVGSWCFFDHGLAPEAGSDDLGIGPHPHIGLQTVTWLLSGEFLHTDSLGTEQPIRPGELNLMTAGHGVVHAEQRTGTAPPHVAQLWVAQPADTRNGPPAFEHHGDLPQLDVGDGVATVLIGDLGGVRSPARRDTDHFGADIELRTHATIPLHPEHEHALVALRGTVEIDGRHLTTDQLAYLPPGRDQIELHAPDGARLLLLGGAPFEDPVLMWWNYVARTHEEITAAHHEWTTRSDRFPIPSSHLPAIDVRPPPWL